MVEVLSALCVRQRVRDEACDSLMGVCAGHAAGVSTLFLINYLQTFYWQSRMAVPHFPENYRQLAEGFSWSAFDVM